MKIICDTSLVSEACQNIQRAASGKAAVPALEGILIKTTRDGGGVELSGYDLEMGINTRIDARIEKSGGIILNAKTLCEILRHISGPEVLIESDEKNVCAIKGGDSEYSLIGMRADEFPDMPVVMGGIPVVLAQGLMRDMIRQTVFAVSADESKAIYRGIKFEISDGRLMLVALDGYRLAIRKEEIEYKRDTLSFIVPAKTLSEIAKFMNDDNGFVSVSLGKSHIVFNVNGYNIVSRLLEGDFMNYRAALPENYSLLVKVNTRELIESVERVSLVISEKFRSPLRCIFDGDIIKFSCVTGIGAANDRLPAEIEGERHELGFNNRFLLDALRSCDADIVHIKISGTVSPVIITPPEGEAFIYIIMPTRLKEE